MNFDTEHFLKNKNNFSPNRTIGDIHLNQFYLNEQQYPGRQPLLPGYEWFFI